MKRQPQFISTEQAGSEVGMSAEWVRQQIYSGRLRATVFFTGRRRTYRISAEDWALFLAAYRRQTDDPEWHP
jgi:hypothetical protein